MVLINGLLAAAVTFSALSLIEIKAHPHYSERMQKLTPACSDPAMVCPSGNRDIDKQSAQWPPLESAPGRKDDSTQTLQATTGTMQPFSYVIASDAQLYWFNGEFAEMGRKPMPSSCTPSDSCGRCTGNHGMNANRRLQKAWKSLMTGETDGINASNADLSIPQTLVMNGELCYTISHDVSPWANVNNLIFCHSKILQAISRPISIRGRRGHMTASITILMA